METERNEMTGRQKLFGECGRACIGMALISFESVTWWSGESPAREKEKLPVKKRSLLFGSSPVF